MVSTPPPLAELNDLRRLSRHLGEDMMMVQGAGGNTSLKDGNCLWVKASGLALAEAERRDIFVPLDLTKVRAHITALDDEVKDSILTDNGLRPSIETSLHALMPQRVVLHMHTTCVIASAIRKDTQTFLQRKLAGLNWAFVPYARPGLPLALAIKQELRQRSVDILILGNHGLLVAGESCAAAKTILECVLTRLQAPVQIAPAPDLQKLQEFTKDSSYTIPDDPLWHGIATDPRRLAIASKGVLYPDHAVFLGCKLGIMQKPEELAQLKENLPLIAVPSAGILLRKDISANARAMVGCLALVLAQTEPYAVLHYLDARELNELLNWDAEKYRQSLASG